MRELVLTGNQPLYHCFKFRPVKAHNLTGAEKLWAFRNLVDSGDDIDSDFDDLYSPFLSLILCAIK